MGGIKPMKKIMIVLCIFGLTIGGIFPLFAGSFIRWIPGKKMSFIIACYGAGWLVGMFGYYIIKQMLMHIDSYYKRAIIQKLGVNCIKESHQKQDLILAMKEEFDELLNRFAEMRTKEKDRLITLAITDSLTNLYNHRYFFEYFYEKISENCGEMAVLFCDIDRFKSVNDIHGHVIGDLVLKDVSIIIKEVVAHKGGVFRYGGEEFVILLDNHAPNEALEIAEEIRLRVSNGNKTEKLCKINPVTISIGLSSYPAHGKNIEELIDKADRAMYYAKQNGRNQCCFYGNELEYNLLINNPELIKKEMLLNSATALAAAIDAKDSNGEKHSKTVSRYALLLADRLNFSQNDRMALKIGGLLHDCGKMGIPDAVIQKMGPLTEAEWRIIKNHTLAGSDFVKYISKTPSIDECIRYHHERWDGMGYPDGLAGLAIPVHARIISIADAYHAMTADRPYRKALSQQQAFEELRNNMGTQFDPNLVETFIESIKAQDLQESA